MKMKYLALLMMVFLTLSLLTACSISGTARALDRAEDAVEQKLDAAEHAVEDAVRKAVQPQTPATLPETQLTPEQAEKIALDHAGFAAEGVTQLRTEFEYDDGIPQYDVSFRDGRWEYEYEIHADSGKIQSFEKDD